MTAVLMDALVGVATDALPQILESSASGLARGFATTFGRKAGAAASNAMFGDPRAQAAAAKASSQAQVQAQVAQPQPDQQMVQAIAASGSFWGVQQADPQVIANQIAMGYQMGGGQAVKPNQIDFLMSS